MRSQALCDADPVCPVTTLALVLCAIQQLGARTSRVASAYQPISQSANQPVRLALVHDLVNSDLVTRAIGLTGFLFC